MPRPARSVHLVLAMALTLTIAGCAPETSEADDDATISASPSTSTPAGVPDLVPVTYDAPRDLTDTEKKMLFEPGPLAAGPDGEIDQDAVVDAVRALEPRAEREWRRAILAQIHGDYADALRGTVEFEYEIDDPARGPDEKPAGDAVVGTNHFALVLDASGSMAAASGDGTRMEAAQDALRHFVTRLPAGSTVSLRVYGDKGDNTAAGKSESCRSHHVVYDGAADHEDFTRALDAVEPVGWTPLARGIEAASGDVPPEATDAIVYVVTDGLETCGGDPVAAARDLADGGVRPIVNVIGFEVGDTDHEELREIARAGGGTYTDADTGAELERYLDEEYSRMMDAWDEWKRVELDRIDEAGNANMDEAETYGTTIMDTAEAEGAAGMEVTRALAAAGALDSGTETAVWNFFLERKNELWRYGYETKATNWGNAYREKVSDWGEVYSTGTTRWSEYYRELYEN